MVVLGIDIGKQKLFANLQDGDGLLVPQMLGFPRPIANKTAGLQQHQHADGGATRYRHAQVFRTKSK